MTLGIKKIRVFGREFYVNTLTKQERLNRKNRVSRITENKNREMKAVKQYKKVAKQLIKKNRKIKDKTFLEMIKKQANGIIESNEIKAKKVLKTYKKDIADAKNVVRKSRSKNKSFTWYRLLFWEVRRVN